MLLPTSTSRHQCLCCNWHAGGLLQLAEVFEAEIDPVMKMLGFCCGQKYVFVPQVLICYGKQLCTVPVNAVYYSYQNR